MKMKIAYPMALFFLFQASSYQQFDYEPRYSLSQNSIVVEVGTVDFDPSQYILRNRRQLSDLEKEQLIVQGNVDSQVIGTYDIAFNHTYQLAVEVKDTKAPEIKMNALSLEVGESFAWSDEVYTELQMVVSDNATPVEELLKTLSCDEVDTNTSGQKQVPCRIHDTSNNEKEIMVAVHVTAKEMQNVAPTKSQPAINANTQVSGKAVTTKSLPSTNYTQTQLAEIQQVFDLINLRRAEVGLYPLQYILGDLHALTYVRTTEIQQSYAHTRPDGTPWSTIFSEYGLGYHSAGENLARGQQSADEVMNDWMNSPTHRDNILSGEFRAVSIGVLGSGQDKVWVQEYIY